MTAHIHAARMAEYAQDASETDEPWRRWEKCSLEQPIWMACKDHPVWHYQCNYRRKPRTININGIEVHEPMREVPACGVTVYVTSIDGRCGPELMAWCENGICERMLARGLCHSTREAAETHARALLSFTEVKS